MKKRKIIKIILLIIVLIFFLVCFLYFNDYYKANKVVEKYLRKDEVTKKENYYFFDGPSNSEAIIFYPGAKVESTSYTQLLYTLSQKGPDCFLVTMPLNIAFFNPNAAKNIINNYKYDNWYMMGHSLGGVVATNYANKSEDIKGLILLASYPNKEVNNKLTLLSLYGSNDKVLNRKKYNENKKFWPSKSKEIVIKGGNHAYYGNYGEQKGDGKATINNKEQQKQTIEAIIDYLY